MRIALLEKNPMNAVSVEKPSQMVLSLRTQEGLILDTNRVPVRNVGRPAAVS